MKLIKINDNHYIIVDDSEIKEDTYYFSKITNNVFIRRRNGHWIDDYDKVMYKKITHSTQPLEKTTKEVWEDSFKKYDLILLSEVEEAINGYSVEKMALSDNSFYRYGGDYDTFEVGYKAGFNVHKELVKEKLFTVDDIKNSIIRAYSLMGSQIDVGYFDEIIQSLLPKTEWECTIDEQGKLKLI